MNTTQKYLLLDRGIVDGHRCENTALRLCPARKETRDSPLLREEFFSDPPRRCEVLRDPATGAFRLYYTTFVRDDDSARTPLSERSYRHYLPSSERITATCCATSADGLRWKKLDLGFAEFEGSLANNILLKNAHGTSVLYDADDVDPAKRYKLITKMEYSRGNTFMGVAFSSDGLEFDSPRPWPAHNPAADTHNYAFKDPRTGRYVLITRIWRDGLRIAAKSESNDFLNWSEPTEVARGLGFENQIYSMPVFTSANIYLGLASIYHEGDRSAPNFDTVDLTLLYSTDLGHFDWIELGASLIERGEGSYPNGAWDCGCVFASPPIEIDGKLCIYYMGGNGRHTDFRETGLGRAWIEKDKFACYSAKDCARDAVLTMREANFYGNRLRLLADIDDDGWIRCELLGKEAGANPYARAATNEAVLDSVNFTTAGYRTPQAPTVSIHTSGWSEIRFNENSLSSFGSLPCALRFTFRNARLYALEGDLSIIRRD